MFEPTRLREAPQREVSLLGACLSCLGALVRCMCCLDPTDISGEGGQRLLSVHQEASSLGIEASAASPPRLPMVGASERGPLLKGQGPSSSSRGSLQPAASPPMPPPFFPAATRRHKRRSSDASRHSGSASSASSPGGGGSPKAAGSGKGEVEGQGGLPLVEDEDICPTCLDPYTEDNPKVLTRCNHHFHLPCLYEWLERSETCPVCSKPMAFEEIM